MSDLRREFITTAELFVTASYCDHYKRFASCAQGDLRDPQCLERGLNLNGEGFSCMGVSIRAMCLVIGLDPRLWPVDFQHLEQLAALAEARPAEPGDTIIYRPNGFGARHMGVLVAPGVVVHAKQSLSSVVKERVRDLLPGDEVITPEVLASVPILDQKQAA